MIALIQRVTRAAVDIDGHRHAQIGAGLLVLLGVEREDDTAKVERMIDRVLNYRVFGDDQGRMNVNVQQVDGEVLLVSQFTLPADTRKGNRPSFARAAEPDLGLAMYDHAVKFAATRWPGKVQSGVFAAAMQIELVNDGPVTFWLQS